MHEKGDAAARTNPHPRIELLVKHLDAIIDSSFDGLWICDGEGKVVRVNRASEVINGIQAKQVLNRKIADIVEEGIIDRSVTLEVLKRRTSVTMIQNLRNGKQILVTGNPVFDEQGEISLVVVNDRDLTALNKLRAELERSRALSQEYRKELFQMYNKEGLLKDVVIRSDCMHRVLDRAMKVAQFDTTVLLQGESGVGKGLFAGLIHRASKRKDAPFLRVDCGAIPESLIESELFGYEAGAFTGARVSGKPGRFEMADGGTLFLDEIGELPLAVQVKLLRFIEANEVIHVGGTQIKKIDARIIAASHRDLGEMAQKGRFRQDLFYRLNVVPIVIPPLRERPQDIPPLVHCFLEIFNRKFATKKILGPGTLDLICRYSFPGNIRELSNLIEQLVVLSPQERISPEDLPSHVRQRLPERQTASAPPRAWDLRSAVRDVEKKRIVEALRVFGSQRKAAGPLGINQSTLARKAKRYGITNDALLHYDAGLQRRRPE